MVAIAATLCSLIIGVTYGALSGLLGGRIDNLMMRLVDVLYSIPFIFVVIFLITIVRAYGTALEDSIGLTREVIFYLVITPISIVFKLIGRDSMTRSFDAAAATYWITRRQPTSVKRYLRQF